MFNWVLNKPLHIIIMNSEVNIILLVETHNKIIILDIVFVPKPHFNRF